MEKISYVDLGKYIGKKANDYFDRWYSSDVYDYENEIANCNENYNEEENLYYCNIEIAEVGKAPLIINYYCRYVYDNIGNVVDTIYYI